MKKSDDVTTNEWKRYFYMLFIGNIVFVMMILTLIYYPVPDSKLPYPNGTSELDEESSEFFVRTTKSNLNELVNAYLNKLLKNTEHRYYVMLDDDVQLFGELPVFSSTVPLFINFEPIVQQNGDIVLKQKSISLGLLELPNKKIMSYIDRYLPMPEWVTVNAKEEEIYVNVTEMNIKSNFKVEVQQFDLEANDISLKIKVPYKSLGIDIENDLKINE